MNNKQVKSYSQRFEELRNDAEKKLAVAPVTQSITLNPKELLHELQVHQIELEMQNEELRRAHIALEASRDHFIHLYDFAPVGYISLSQDGVIVEMNLTAAKLLGVERKAILHQRFAQFIADTDKDKWYRHHLSIRKNSGEHACELRLIRAKESRFYAHLDCQYTEIGGSAPLLRIALTDISERKQAEEALRIAATAFESQDSIMVTDTQQVILRVNQSFSLITGYSSEEAVGKTPVFLRSEYHDDAFYEALWTAVARNGYWQGEIWNKRKNGEVFPAWQTITAVKDAEGHVTHHVGYFIDITLYKRAEKVLLDARHRLESQVVTTTEELEKVKQETAEINLVLSVFLKLREADKSDARHALSNEIENTILPFLIKLKKASTGRHQSLQLIEILEGNLRHLIHSYGESANIPVTYQKLTPVETQVASMVRQGLSTKAIAATLNSSFETVGIHRKHIRKKLGLIGKSRNLHSYLLTLGKT